MPSPFSRVASVFVFASVTASASTTASSPAPSLAATASRSAARRISVGRRLSYLRGRGPNGLPPPFHWVARIEPWRARPVPFCFQGLRPPPETSLRPRVECVPARRAASSLTTAWWSRGMRGVRAEHVGGQLERLGLAGAAADRNAGHGYLASRAFCCCALVCFTLLRITTSPPIAPGTAPRSRIRFCSGSTRATTRLSTVRRSPPIRPGR